MIKLAAEKITELINADNNDDMAVIEPKILTTLAMCGIFIHDTDGFMDAINRGGLTPQITETIIEQFKN